MSAGRFGETARVIVLGILMTAPILGCSPGASEKVLRSFPVSDLQGVLATEAVFFDTGVSHDGTGSLRVESADSLSIILYQVDGLDLTDALLNLRAVLRTEHLAGEAYLQMQVRLPGRGEYVVGARASPLHGTTEWTDQRTGFLLRKGQSADRARLGLVVTGPGTVWIDEILLTRGRLEG